jgi:hypothetical protein
MLAEESRELLRLRWSRWRRFEMWEKRATVLVQQNPQFAHSGASLPGRQGEGEATLGGDVSGGVTRVTATAVVEMEEV